ncbi:MAG: polyprenol phosphomannose-dependent alpha 1,6 mannosyltransferase MptB [Actinomycetota bacterium]|nr:polyprenol phosphomannose-dependent alpha 1,6 mannosyltransferase MptB [Actinomycetota bacterium]
MSELNQGTVRVLAFARDQVRSHSGTALAFAGFLAASTVVIAGGRVGTVKATIPLTDWMGLLSAQGRRTGDYLPGTLMLGGIIVLIALWIVAVRLIASGEGTERRVWGIAGAWAAPFVIGPPMLSNDVWSYAAQGLMQRNGLDPYKVGPAALGNVHVVAAVDPSWRSLPSPYGPLATTVQHLAVAISGGSPLGAAIVFRALGVACFIAIGLLAADLAGRRRIQALTLTILNPLLLLHVISGAHLEGVMCALLLGALFAAHQRRWLLAVVLACAAGSVKAPAFIAVLAIIAVHNEGYRGRTAWRIAARDIAVAVLSVLAMTAVVRDGWGWLKALNTPTLGHTPLAPASLLGDMFDPVVRAASFDDLAAGGRITTMLAAVCIVIYLTVTSRQRALARTIGYGLLAVGLLGPVVYPWYLLWAVVCLAPTARAAHRDWIVLISAVACVLNPPGFTSTISTNLGAAALAVGAAIMALRYWALGRSGRASAGATADPAGSAGPDDAALPDDSAPPVPTATSTPTVTNPRTPQTPQVSVGG